MGRKLFVVLALLNVVLLTPVFVAAETDRLTNSTSKSVMVEVRTVEASDPLPQNNITESPLFEIDARLDDLRSKLEKLHYRTFKLIGAQSQVLPILQKESLVLVNGQTLTMRPLYVSPKRIGLWLKWSDKTGAEVLDTRMHFDPGESMLTGSETEGAKATVLAIDVKPMQ
jgi:hypothetical protein